MGSELDNRVRQRLSLDGFWGFRLDPEERGKRERWYREDIAFENEIIVPGCWEAQGFGERHAPAELYPSHVDFKGGVRTPAVYNGPAWYEKLIDIPQQWEGKRVWLHIGGINFEGEFWMNGELVGDHRGYSSPFKFDVTELARFGRKNLMVARIGNDLREDAYGGFDYFTNWGGIHRSIYLETVGSVWIEDAFAKPKISPPAAEFEVHVKRIGWEEARFDVAIEIGRWPDGKPEFRGQTTIELDRTEMEMLGELRVEAPRAAIWSLAEPNLYYARVTVAEAGHRTVLDEQIVRFGFREVSISGKHILLNEKPILLRATSDNCIFPLTVCPPPFKSSYERDIRLAKEYGFNLIRPHSWVPYQEHLEAADELGILMQVELPTGRSYLQHHTRRLEGHWKDELGRIIRGVRNNPSVIGYCLSNNAGNLDEGENGRLLGQLRELSTAADPTRFTLSTLGGHASDDPILGIDLRRMGVPYLPFEVSGFNDPCQWRSSVKRPLFWYQLGCYSSFPNPALREKYGGAMVPFWADRAERAAAEKNRSHLLPAFINNSERLQRLSRKVAIEFARKMPALGGFEWRSLKDSAWAVEGLVDDFGHPKHGASAEEFRRLNADSVLLMEEERRTGWCGQALRVEFLISHYGDFAIDAGELSWELVSDVGVEQSGQITVSPVQNFAVSKLHAIALELPQYDEAKKLELRLSLAGDGFGLENSWDFWVFPRDILSSVDAGIQIYDPQSRLMALEMAYPFLLMRRRSDPMQPVPEDTALLIAGGLTTRVLDYLGEGGRVLLISRRECGGLRERPVGPGPGDCAVFFAPSPADIPQTDGDCNLGTIIEKHPVMAAFPHEGFCDLPFYHLCKGGRRIDLEQFPDTVTPIIWSITDYRYCEGAAYLLEVAVGRGRLLATTLNFEETLAIRPESLFLFDKLLRYCLGEDFAPSERVPRAILEQ